MNLAEKQRQLLENYEPITDPQERMALVVDEGLRASILLPLDQRTDENKIRGCISAAWLRGELVNGACQFRCAADSPLVQGLLACLCSFFSDLPPGEIVRSDADPLGSLGLTRNLSPTRQNGLGHARRRIVEIAASLDKSTGS